MGSPKLLYLVLCDGFSTDPNTGKKTFLGVFDRITASTLPTKHPNLAIAAGLEGGGGVYDISIAVTNPEGKPIFQSPNIKVEPKDPYRREDIAVQIFGLQLGPSPGRYQIIVASGDHTLGSYPLYVEQQGEAGAAQSLPRSGS